MIEFFKTLNIEIDITEKELKKAFRELSKKYHPDMNGGSNKYVDKLIEVQKAYETLLVFINSNKYETWKKEQKNYSENEKQHTEQNTTFNFSYYEYEKDKDVYEEEEFIFDFHVCSSLKKQHSISDAIQVGGLSYRVLNYLFLKEFGNSFFKAKSDGYFLIIDIETCNLSKSMISIHNYMFRIFDFDGCFYEFSTEGLSKLHWNQEPIIPFFGKEQNPKIKSKYRIIFEVPEIGDYFLQFSSEEYTFDKNNICIGNEIETIKLKM